MMEKRRVTWLLIGMVSVLLIALAAVELGANLHRPTPPQSMITAQDLPSNHTKTVDGKPETGGGLVPTGGALLEPPPPSPKNPNKDDEDPGDEEPEEEKTTVVERHTIWKILFPYETLGESVQAAIGKMIAEAAADIAEQVRDGISGIASAVLEETDFTRGIREVRHDVWKVGIVIAGILMPLSFMASVVTALKDGTTSVTGYANAREALINWVVAAGGAISSYYILTKMIELSSAAMSAIFSGLLGVAVNNFSLGDYFNGVLFEALIMANPGGAQIFLAVFGILLALALVTSIGLAFMAREVILILAVGVAPVMLVMGSVGPLRWLNGLWLKVTTIAMLLGPANAFLIGSSALLALNARQSSLDLNGMGGRILGYLIALGIISVLIGLNTIIGKMVYGAVIEIAEKALNGIMVAAGAVVGTAAMGALGGVGAAATTAGTAGAGGAAAGQGAASAATQASSAAKAVGAIGRAASAMGLPGGRGFSAGMDAGASLSAHNQIKQGIAEAADLRGGRMPNEPWDNRVFSGEEAVATAGAYVQSEINSVGEKGALGSYKLSQERARSRASSAEKLMGNVVGLGARHNVDMLAGLRQMGVGGRNAQQALTAYSRESIKSLAFQNSSPFNPVDYRQLPKELSLRDLDTAVRIASEWSGHASTNVNSIELLDSLAQTAFQRRVQFKEPPDATVNEAAKVASLDGWMRSTYQQLPDQGLAYPLGQILGI